MGLQVLDDSSARGELVRRKVEQLQTEIRHAVSRTSTADLRGWALQSAHLFGGAFVRRVKNVGQLVVSVGRGVGNEMLGAYDAWREERLGAHAQDRALVAKFSAHYYWHQSGEFCGRMKALVKANPAEAAGQLATATLVSLIVSGGPDADGGAPDLDLMFGIDAHRSIFSHSIIMGAALETALLSFFALVQLAHKNLPLKHDPVWDEMLEVSQRFTRAANVGASIGVAYHLLADGLVQVAAYKDLGVSLPMEAHQSIFVANGLAEALDASNKTVRQGEAPHGSCSAADLSEHKKYSGRCMEIGEAIETMVTPARVKLLRKKGVWLYALAWGVVAPTSEQQMRFLDVVYGRRDPATEYELAYVEARVVMLVCWRVWGRKAWF